MAAAEPIASLPFAFAKRNGVLLLGGAGGRLVLREPVVLDALLEVQRHLGGALPAYETVDATRFDALLQQAGKQTARGEG